MSESIYKIISDKIIERLKQGEIPWKKPWRGGIVGVPRQWNGTPYRGINLFWLSLESRKYPFYFGYKRLVELNGVIKKDQFFKHSYSYFYKIDKKKDEETGQMKTRFIFRPYKVWNYEQLESINLPDSLKIIKDTIDKQEEIDSEKEKEFALQEAEDIITLFKDKPVIQEKDDRAYYRPIQDLVNMPKKQLFERKEDYYSTLFHELVHSTGHTSRLDREGIQKGYFGDDIYSKEELIAEFGSTFLCGFCGIEQKIIENSAAYIQNWIKQLKDHPGILVQASQQAAKAVDYIKGIFWGKPNGSMSDIHEED